MQLTNTAYTFSKTRYNKFGNAGVTIGIHGLTEDFDKKRCSRIDGSGSGSIVVWWVRELEEGEVRGCWEGCGDKGKSKSKSVVSLSVCLTVCFSACLSIYLFLYLSVYLSLNLSFDLPFSLSVC